MAVLYKRIVQALIAAAYPHRCLVCGTFRPGASPDEADRLALPMGEPGAWDFETLVRPYVCRACRATFTPIVPPLCRRCGMLFKSRAGTSHLCGDCLKKPGHFTMARAVGVYDQVMMAVVHQLKYRGRIQLARPLGRCLFAEFMRHWGPEAVDIIVPVPLHTRRFRRRGFNQAFLLVREWRQLAATLASSRPALQVDPHVLARNRRTAPQSGLGRQERQANLRKTMTIAAASPIRGKHVLVVDDVFTTGSTADECARTLLAGGARRVDILTLARVL